MNIINTLKIIIRNKWARFRIRNTDFTIISNNCWGGFIYQMLKLPYNSPTIGLFMYASDYVEFCSNIKYYLNQEMVFIEHKDSKYYNEFKNKVKEKYPIGKINDIEIHFLHYKTEVEAKEKWERRKLRINWDNIIFKFSQRDLCSKQDISNFMELDYKNKICFSYEHDIRDIIYVPELRNMGSKDETEITLKYFKVIKYFNDKVS